MTRRVAVAVADEVVRDLSDALGLPVVREARPGAPGLMEPGVLLRAADGWVHPGPPTAWDDFAAMIAVLEHRPPPSLDAPPLPDVSALPAEIIDATAGEWLLPAVAVRGGPAPAPPVPRPAAAPRLEGATVVVLGATWAAPLAGAVLARLGARVVRAVDPRRPDPFPLAERLRVGVTIDPTDLGTPEGQDHLAAVLAHADLLVDATSARVIRNAGLDDVATPIVRIAAFAHDDRPGYGLAAEARGGWATRHDPPRLGRSSVADPVAGLLAALHAVELLDARAPAGARARVSLEEAVGLLLARERADG